MDVETRDITSKASLLEPMLVFERTEGNAIDHGAAHGAAPSLINAEDAGLGLANVGDLTLYDLKAGV